MERRKKPEAPKQKRKKQTIESDIDKTVSDIEERANSKDVISDGGVYFPSGSDLLNLILGGDDGGGYQCGKMVNIIGDKSGGKTLLACELIAAARAKLGNKLEWFYDDAEAGFSFDAQALWGFEIMREGDEASFTIEDFRARLTKKLNALEKGHFLIYVLDCFDSLTTAAEVKHAKEKQKAAERGTDASGTYGTSKAKEMSEFFRLMRKDIKDKNCLLVIISQVRENIGVMFGEKYTRTGGKSLDFYASILMWLAEAEKLKRKGIPVGVSIKVRTKKNKQRGGHPFRECFLQMYFDYGIDNILTNLDYLFDQYTNKGKLRWAGGKDDDDSSGKEKETKKIKWDGHEMTIEHAVKYIERRNQEEKLREMVAKKFNDLQDSISSKGRKPRY